jgi:erythromycin esterase-like protein
MHGATAEHPALVREVTPLGDFERFPAWMWRNRDVGAFVEWLHVRNAAHADHRSRVRFYGLDLYSLRSSMQAVVRYLDERDSEAAAKARARYSGFDHVGGEGAAYGKAVALDIALPCESEVVAQLVDLRDASSRLLARDGWVAEDEFFFAEQNAKLGELFERTALWDRGEPPETYPTGL